MPKIIKIHDNIVTIEGKANYKQDQLFRLSKDAVGFVVSATQTEANLLVIGDPSTIQNKKAVTKISDTFDKVEVRSGFFGSIISPFGNVLFPAKKEAGKKIGEGAIENNSPALLDRIKLSQPLETGMLAIDTMIPIGRGQRELIIGDRSTGKTTIALNAIINQKDKKTKSIYVAVGQKRTSVIATYNKLVEHKALDNTIVIFSNPDSSAEQFLAPRIGMAMAEALAYQGEDVLIVIDDLTKHANVAREISLSIGKNPGREAYPTDIFYQHSRLLERAGRFNEKYKKGSITCLPVVETVQGDIASLIPSNVISITDGQIFTSAETFNEGKFPAINIGLSVSRTGSAVQSKTMKFAARQLKAEYSELFDIKKFSDMSIEISDELKGKIKDWSAINNILLQFGHVGYSEEQIVVLTELFRMKAMSDLIDSRMFSVAFITYSIKDQAAARLLKDIKANKYATNLELLRKHINAVFTPLVRIASGVHTDIITQKEYEKLRGGK